MTIKQHSAFFLLPFWLTAALFLLGCPGSSYAQIVQSRDNHTNLWQNRSAWQQNWSGISSTENITDAEATIFGYVTNGLSATPSDLSFTGASGQLVVEDTLRIHGNFTMLNGASLHIKPGGILIVHGNYQQDANVNFTNEGQAIFKKNWASLGNSGAFSNTGNLYIKDTVTEGGITTSYKPLSDLATENELLYYFTYVRVISAVCSGNNHDTLTFSGSYQSIVHWESSHSFFRNDTTIIANQTTTQLYTNLTKTTSYRVYYETRPPMPRFKYSTGGTIITLEESVGGSLSGPSAVCADPNGTLSLSNFIGEVIRWESSTDGFNTNITVVANEGESFTFSNLSKTTSYRAIVRNGDCNESYSAVHTVHVSPAAKGGTLAGSTEVCADVNSGELSLSDYSGDIVSWESSTDGFATVTTITHTSALLSYKNLSQTTSYRVMVESGACSQAYSTVATITVSPQSKGGTLTGSTEKCAGVNSGSLSLSGHTGDILRWESSTDNFATTTSIAATSATLAYENLSQTTSYRAVVKSGVCEETYSTVATITVSPATVGGTVNGSTEVCAGVNSGSLSLSGHTGDILRWESSTDNFTTTTSIASVEATLSYQNLSSTTSYRAVVKSGVCEETYSSVATISVSPSSVGGTVSGSAEVCAGVNSGSLSLSGHTGDILRWESSTDNFATTTSIAATSATLAYENLSQTTSYRAVVKSGVCEETYSTVATITVSPATVGGTVNGSTEVCAGVNSGSLSLSGHTGDILRWESSTDNFATTTSIASTSATLAYENLSQTTSYRAVVKSGVCEEAYSEIGTISVNQLAGGTLAGEQTVCSGDNVGELQLSGWQGDILRWESSTDNFTTINPIVHTSAVYSFQNLTETSSFRAVIGNGICEEVYSTEVQVSVQAQPSAGRLLGAATVCANENSGSLQLESFEGSILRWERSTDDFATNIETIAQTTSTLTYENLSQTTAYRVVVGSTPCSEVYSEAIVVQVEEASAGGVLAGGKRIKPGENEGMLELQSYVGEVVQWELSTDNFNQDVQVLAHSNTSLSFQNLEVETWYRVLVKNNNCPAVFSEAAHLWLNMEPVALPDTFWVVSGLNFTSTKSLLANDYDPDGDGLSLTYGQNQTTAGGNRLDIREDGTIYYEPQAGFQGVDSLQYRLCDVAGEASRCVNGWMYLLIEEEAPAEKELIIYQGVSPNGDGLNDSWVLEHIEQYPDNHVQLFDRFGVLVYETKGYNNQEKVFAGKSNKGTVSGDGSLPDATYFYRIKLSLDLPALKGYVILNR